MSGLSISGTSAREVANYVTQRFIHEPDVWRVHLRTISSLLDAVEATTRQGDEIERSVRNAEYFFLSGLYTIGIAFATLIVVVTFRSFGCSNVRKTKAPLHRLGDLSSWSSSLK